MIYDSHTVPDKISNPYSSIKEIILEYINVSKILLKLDKSDIGLWLLASSSSSDVNTGTIFDNLSLAGYTLWETETFKSVARGWLIMSLKFRFSY